MTSRNMNGASLTPNSTTADATSTVVSEALDQREVHSRCAITKVTTSSITIHTEETIK